MQEGEIWEGAMFASHHNLNNLCAIADYNKLQSDDSNENIMGLEPLYDKWKSFGWNVLEIDGHNEDEIINAFKLAKDCSSAPTFIIAHTIKGKGVSHMEMFLHGMEVLNCDDELRDALIELGASKNELR